MIDRVYVEITNVCNLSCCFCPKTKRESKFLSLSEFEIICQKLKGVTNYLFLHVLGEPLLHHNLKGILDLTGKYGYNVNITTNGTLLDKQSEVLLNAKNIKKIFVSLQSFEGNGGVNLKEYLDKVYSFSEKAKCIVSFRLWNVGGKDKRNSEIIEYFINKTGKDVVSLFKEKDSITIGEKRYLEKAEMFEWPSMDGEIKGVKTCHALTSQIAILSNGTIVPCCLDKEGIINLGNIFTDDIDKVLNGKRALEILEGFKNRKVTEELCKRCGYAKRF